MIFPCRYVFESYDYFQTKATSAEPRLLFARTLLFDGCDEKHTCPTIENDLVALR